MASQLSRGGVVAVAVLVAGAAGLIVGRMVAERRHVNVVEHAPSTTWAVGDPFPSVPLVAEWGDTVGSDALLADGGVVLFLDVECPPCADMAKKWDRASRAGVLAADRVVGITSQGSVAVSFFRRDGDLQIPIYRDDGGVFVANGWVASYPLEVVVARDGTIRAISEDATAPVDSAVVRGALARPF